jgi:hypothetical protein
MKNKTLSLLSLSILAVVVLASFASALDLSSSTASLSQTSGSFTLTLANTAGAGALTYSVKDSSDNTYTGFTFDKTSFTGNGSLTVNYTVPADFSFNFEKQYTVTVTATETAVPSNTKSVQLPFENKFYSGENKGDLSISGVKLNVLEGFGDDDNYWYPFDKVEVKFKVENNGNWDVKNIEIKACLFDKSSKKCVMDEGDMDISEDDFDLDSKDDQASILTFTVDADELKAGNNDYAFYIKAVGEIDDSDSAYDGNDTGYSTSNSIRIITNDDFVTLTDIQFGTNVACGGTVQVTGTAWNIGDEDEEDVYIKVYNADLGINKQVTIGDIDSFDSKDFSFTLNMPSTAKQNSVYSIEFLVYDKKNHIFESQNDDQAKLFRDITVTEGCSTVPSALVTASLQSDAVAGNEFTVKAIVTNTGSSSSTFNLALTGYNTWASLVSMDKNSVTLAAGASQDVLITLKANDDVSGAQTFSVGLTEGTKSLSQPVSVSVAEKSKAISFLDLSKLFGSSSWIWVIGALNAVLVLVIVVVAVKVSKKK